MEGHLGFEEVRSGGGGERERLLLVKLFQADREEGGLRLLEF